MRRTIILSALLLSAASAAAQDTATTTLGELTVKARRIITTKDGLRIFPSVAQLESSPSGYALLQRLSLPGIRVDELGKTITATDAVGAVQVRINGILATQDDITHLDMQAVQRIDLIQQPGLRYGEDVGLVIDIHTRRAESGWVAAAELTQALTHRDGNDNIHLKANRGKSELALNYGFGWDDRRGTLYGETTSYTLTDGTVHTVARQETAKRTKTLSHDVGLRYNLAAEDRYVLQAGLTGSFSNMPVANALREHRSGSVLEQVHTSTTDKSLSPQADIYFHCRLPKGQSLTANVVGSYGRSDYSYAYTPAAPGLISTPYSYAVDGRSRYLFSEAVYENRLKPFTLSAGFRHENRHTDNRYSGDTHADNVMRTSSQYLFAQLQGALGSRFGYRAGMGVSLARYGQDSDSYTYWLPRPLLSLSYRPADCLQLRYEFEMTVKPPRLSRLSDVAVRVNEMETLVGNPQLEPARRTENRLSADYTGRRVQSSFFALYRGNAHTDMQRIIRTTDSDGHDTFLFTISNQGSINMLYLSDYTTFHVVPDKLDLSLNASFSRCFNNGADYRHYYSAWMYGADIVVYLGRFTLSAHADNGWRFMEGETSSRQHYSASLSASCRLGRWGTVSLFWLQPFDNNITLERTELLNRYMHKTAALRSTDSAQQLTLRLSVNLSRGRKYRTPQKTLHSAASDSGLIKQ